MERVGGLGDEGLAVTRPRVVAFHAVSRRNVQVMEVLQALQRVMQFVEWVGHVGFLPGWLIFMKASGRDTCRVPARSINGYEVVNARLRQVVLAGLQPHFMNFGPFCLFLGIKKTQRVPSASVMC